MVTFTWFQGHKSEAETASCIFMFWMRVSEHLLFFLLMNYSLPSWWSKPAILCFNSRLPARTHAHTKWEVSKCIFEFQSLQEEHWSKRCQTVQAQCQHFQGTPHLSRSSKWWRGNDPVSTDLLRNPAALWKSSTLVSLAGMVHLREFAEFREKLF